MTNQPNTQEEKTGEGPNALFGMEGGAAAADTPTPAETPKAPFDLAAAIAAEPLDRQGAARLSKTEQCQAYAVIKSGRFTHAIVAKMFGLSRASVSLLANCTERRPGYPWRYPRVAAEWRRLGEDEFMRTYMTEDLWLKAKRLKYDHIIPAQPFDNRLNGSRPRADAYSFDRIGEFVIIRQVGAPYRARVDWVAADPEETPAEVHGPVGWRFGLIEPDGKIGYHGAPRLKSSDRDLPFATSGEAFDAAYDWFAEPSPRRGRF